MNLPFFPFETVYGLYLPSQQCSKMEFLGIPSVDNPLGDVLIELKAFSPDSFMLFAFFSLFGTSRVNLLVLIAAIQRKRNVSRYRFPWNRCCVSENALFDRPCWSKISTVLKGHKLFKPEDIPGSDIEWCSIGPEVCGLTQRLLEKSERGRLVVLAVGWVTVSYIVSFVESSLHGIL
ncbi:unnamed protein product [Penicillium nalgiovense]|nr:unnamed protein product [Penicillium nalgiovense]